jgi:hypothetical protein
VVGEVQPLDYLGGGGQGVKRAEHVGAETGGGDLGAADCPADLVIRLQQQDIPAGIGQCIAEMVAARLFNQQHGTDIPVIYGVVTNGTNWRFLRLIDSTVYIDATEYYIKEVERIVGIIVSMFKNSGVTV